MSFPLLNAELEGLEAPDGRAAFHKKWLEALEQLEDAYTSFLTGSEANFIVAYMQSRRAFSLGKYALYELRAELPKLREYWVLPDALARWDELDTPVAGVEAQTGVIHRPSTDKHAEYSLYVPEYYDPSRSWPLVITLHGGHGRGDDYLLTWLRAAKSAGYLLLSPKSLGGTWSLQRPGVDIRSILSMLETLLDEYRIDIGRLFVSGLSDGGSFSYALGLSCPKLFAGAGADCRRRHDRRHVQPGQGQGFADLYRPRRQGFHVSGRHRTDGLRTAPEERLYQGEV